MMKMISLTWCNLFITFYFFVKVNRKGVCQDD